MALLVAFFTFLAVLAIILLLFTMGSGTPREEIVRRRFEAVQRAERRGDLTLGLQLVRDELLSDVPALNKVLVHWHWANHLHEYIEQSGVRSKPGKILLLSFVLAVGSYLIVAQIYPYVLVALAAGILAGMIPIWVIMFKRSRRFQQFEKHFAEALDLAREALDVSWEALRRVGNLSSASVLVVLDEVMRNQRPAPGTRSILAAMGPGFCAEMLLVRW